jgi:LPPG:FO 2-phospho-L-lactate transferase
MKVVALAGGVGGARLADGLAQALPAGDLAVIVNTGDDFEHLGLHISPDLDTVCYTLAGLANSITGWGRASETWQALETLSTLGGPSWFRLGDRDLGLHLERTRRLRRGDTLSVITQGFCRQWGVSSLILPMSDDPVPTWVSTTEGELPFQEYFVHRQCHPQVTGFRFEGVQQARPAPGVLDALHAATMIVICPSNPWVSIDPILAVPGILPAIQSAAAPVIAVSPIIAGQAVKGPAAKMYAELGIEPSARSVALHYGNLLSGIVIDIQDRNLAPGLATGRLEVYITDSIMKSPGDRLRLAREVIDLGVRILG